MTGFPESLRTIADRVPEAHYLLIMAIDGIPIEKLVLKPEPNMEAISAEYTALLRASISAAGDTGLGELRELTIVTEKMVGLLRAITPEYFLFAALAPSVVLGRARFALRLAGIDLEPEFL
jgi:predicted regulator of Ras-like GTPase activity (Roadblock/LC7/MglB family)